ncbi:hypothetical protein ACFV1W_32845 [Kitasatospora sp. NPDC059648]|uniref:hypothetical protein n=1 Tax=Kitasatospora sp. NPDC059648 TaxID=3346894 RepID=UPI0036CE4B23
MNDTALAVEPPLRRVVRLVDHSPAEQPEAVVRTVEPAPVHDRGRAASCRIAMQFED